MFKEICQNTGLARLSNRDFRDCAQQGIQLLSKLVQEVHWRNSTIRKTADPGGAGEFYFQSRHIIISGCPNFNKKLQSIQRNRKVWFIKQNETNWQKPSQIKSRHQIYQKKTVFLNSCSVTVVPIFPPLLSPALSNPCSQKQSPSHCPCPWALCIHSPSFPHYPCPLPSGPGQFVLYFHVSASFGSFVCFIYQVPLIGEIVWYLSFTALLTSLSVMLSSSIHGIIKGMSSFFLSAA